MILWFYFKWIFVFCYIGNFLTPCIFVKTISRSRNYFLCNLLRINSRQSQRHARPVYWCSEQHFLIHYCFSSFQGCRTRFRRISWSRTRQSFQRECWPSTLPRGRSSTAPGGRGRAWKWGDLRRSARPGWTWDTGPTRITRGRWKLVAQINDFLFKNPAWKRKWERGSVLWY